MIRSFHLRSGFTLFEVSISLAIVSFGVVSVLMLLPAGIKAQQMARYQILASAKALELVESNAASHNRNLVDCEAEKPWDVHINYKNQHPDLESRVSNYANGMFPLPIDIAKRLDSDGDEIQRVISEGGYIYYSQPLATTGFQESGFAPTTPPNEAQRLVIGVVGYPQNNALIHLPQKAWPYYAAYPSPPIHVIRKQYLKSPRGPSNLDPDIGAAGETYFRPVHQPGFPDEPAGNPKWDVMLWENLNLKELSALGESGLVDVHVAYWEYLREAAKDLNVKAPLVVPLITDPKLQNLARIYAEKTISWCKDTAKVPKDCYDGTLLTDFPSPTNRHLQVIAARIMGHVGPIMLATNVTAAGGVTFNKPEVLNMHENALFLGTQFAARYPYDWGAPRLMQRAIMMDTPLMEYDLLGIKQTGIIFGSAPIKNAEQWKPVTTHKVINAGVSQSYPKALATDALWDSVWGPNDNSTLTAPFEAAERCRQIVVWAVDWQAYEDFETAASAPVDAGRYVKEAPRTNKRFSELCSGQRWMDHHIFTFRNPEKILIFNGDMSGFPAGTKTPPGSNRIPGVHGIDDFGNNTTDQGLNPINMQRFLGQWGADRNANQTLDRGTVPRSVRMRAVTVARFNYYDMRVHGAIR